MTILNALKNGNAPSSAQIGDTIRTAGGSFNVVAPNTPGAKYNPSSGFWSVRDNSPEYMTNAKSLVSNNNTAMSNAAETANNISARSSALSYEFNAREAQKTRDWQEYMSNTAHQREVRDLIAAGLNPVLSATLGGSSTPSGATASGSSYTGQKADIDTSMLPFYAQILGTVLGNRTSENIAHIQADTAMQTAKISSAAQMYSAQQSAAAARYGADQSAAASRYGSDRSYDSSIYGSDKAYGASKYGSDKSYDASTYSTDSSAKGQNTLWRGVNSIVDWMYRAMNQKNRNNDIIF